MVCEDPDMESMFCLNGGKCMQLKTWYDYDADPDNYWYVKGFSHLGNYRDITMGPVSLK